MDYHSKEPEVAMVKAKIGVFVEGTPDIDGYIPICC